VAGGVRRHEMKRLALILLLCLVVFTACGQQVFYKNQATFQWDAVTLDSAGNPFLPTDVVSYDVYIYDHVAGVADPQNPALLISVGNTSALEQLIVFPRRTTWAAGVRVKLTDSGANVTISPIAWSYIVADADVVVGPFLYSPFGTPRKPAALRDKGI
jgi:hypothetical protein